MNDDDQPIQDPANAQDPGTPSDDSEPITPAAAVPTEDEEAVSLEEVERVEGQTDVVADTPQEAVEEGKPYSPPHEPVIVPARDEGAAVTDQGVEDDELERRIIDAIAKNPATSGLNIQVRVNDGVAILDGTVDRGADAEAALGTALAVNGVTDVESRIDTL